MLPASWAEGYKLSKLGAWKKKVSQLQVAWFQLPNNMIIVRIGHTIFYQPFDLQKPAIHPYIFDAQEPSSFFHSVYLIGCSLFCPKQNTAWNTHSGSICILCSVLGVLWPTKITTKSHATPLALCVQTDMNYIFQMRYYTFKLVKSLQNYQTSKLEVKEKSSTWPDSRRLCPGPGWPGGAKLTR